MCDQLQLFLQRACPGTKPVLVEENALPEQIVFVDDKQIVFVDGEQIKIIDGAV
jgi:hypothetical protein